LIPGFDAGKANRAGRPLILQEVKARTPGGTAPKSCRVAAFHRQLDVALLLADNFSDRAGALAVARQNGLHEDEAAVALGTPLGLHFFTSRGVISNTGDAHGLIWTTCAVNKGDSGGPLFLTRRGLLAGITTIDVKTVGAQKLAVCVPAQEIVDSLQRRLLDAWEWRPEYQEITLQLADLIPLED
ncbi:MAG TPA: serine protease, partial [Gemmataceae bacterium]|nr:serine protease [Gemmataceae bacterium]